MCLWMWNQRRIFPLDYIVLAFVAQDSLSLTMSGQCFVLLAVVNENEGVDIMKAQLALLRFKLRAEFENC